MSRAVVLAAAALLSACAAGPAARELRGGEWVAVDINGAPPEGRAPTLRLEGGRASGDAGCNSWSGSYELGAEEAIRFGPIATTRMACDPLAMETERRFLAILAAASGYHAYGDGSISIVAADGRAVRFRRR